MQFSLTAIVLSGLAPACDPALAQSQGGWTFGIGLGNASPTSDNGDLAGLAVDIDDDTRPVFTFEYFVRDNISVKRLFAPPFEHDVAPKGFGDISSTNQLPPGLPLDYHFPTNGPWKPYLGAGID